MSKQLLTYAALICCVLPAFAEPGSTAPTGKTALPIAEPAPTSAEPVSVDAATLARVNGILDAHHMMPTKEDWAKAAGDRAGQAALMTAALDAQAILIRRQRALSGLSFFPTAVNIAGVKSLLTGEQNYRLKGSAAAALARMQGKAAVSALVPLLDHEKYRLRETVIKALAGIQDSAARDALKAHLAKESKNFLKTAIQKVLDTPLAPVEPVQEATP